MNKSPLVQRIDNHDEFCKQSYNDCTCVIAKELQRILNRIIAMDQIERIERETKLELKIEQA